MAVRFTENTVNPDPLPSQRFRAAESNGAEMIGRAVSQFGESIGDYAQVREKINLIHDETAAKQADTASLADVTQIKAKYLTMEGLQAVGAREAANQELHQVKERYGKDLRSPRAQQMFSDVFDRRTAGDLAELQMHEVRQVVAARKSESDARRAAYMSAAVDSHGNAEAFDNNMRTAISELRTIYPGAGEDFIKQKEAELRSSVHSAVVESIMADPENVIDAEEWVQDHAAEILPADETALRQRMQPHLEEIEAEADFGMVQSDFAGTSAASATEEQQPVESPEPSPADREQRTERARTNGDPLRGKSRGTAPGGQFGAPRTKGGKRLHHGQDLAAPEGTPIYPPMEGKVKGEPFFDKKYGGGWSMRIEHPNGRVTGYAHMRSKPPLKAGDRVDVNTVIGSVGHSGTDDGANHLHYTVEMNGRKVDPRTVSWEQGEHLLPSYTPERNDIAAMYKSARRVATRENWSQHRYERALQRIDRMASREDGLYARQQRDATEAAWSRIADIGPEKITSINQVPGFARLPASERIQVLNLIEHNTKEATPAGGDTYFELFEASVNPQQQDEFATVNIDAVPDITPEERRRLKTSQARIRGGAGVQAGKTAPDPATIYATVNRYAPQAGFDPRKINKPGKEGAEDRRRRMKLVDRVQTIATQQAQERNRALTGAEIDEIVRRETITVEMSKPGALWGSTTARVPRYLSDELEGATGRRVNIDQIPTATRNEIRTEWVRARGSEPTAAQIWSVYTRR